MRERCSYQLQRRSAGRIHRGGVVVVYFFHWKSGAPLSAVSIWSTFVVGLSADIQWKNPEFCLVCCKIHVHQRLWVCKFSFVGYPAASFSKLVGRNNKIEVSKGPSIIKLQHNSLFLRMAWQSIPKICCFQPSILNEIMIHDTGVTRPKIAKSVGHLRSSSSRSPQWLVFTEGKIQRIWWKGEAKGKMFQIFGYV